MKCSLSLHWWDCEIRLCVLCWSHWNHSVRVSSCIYSALLVCVWVCDPLLIAFVFAHLSYQRLRVYVCVWSGHSFMLIRWLLWLAEWQCLHILTAHSQLQFAHFDILLLCVCFLSPYVFIVYSHWATRCCILYVYVFAQHGFPCYCRSVMCACSCSRGPLTSLV